MALQGPGRCPGLQLLTDLRGVRSVSRQAETPIGGFTNCIDGNRPAGELVAGVPVIRALSLAWEFKALPSSVGLPAPDRCVVAIGHPPLRQRWQQVLDASGAPLGVVVHPRACVSPSAQLAPGCVVLAGAVVNADAQLARGVLVNNGAVVDHDALCGFYSQLGVNAAMAGELLGCGESRFAELQLTPSAADLR